MGTTERKRQQNVRKTGKQAEQHQATANAGESGKTLAKGKTETSEIPAREFPIEVRTESIPAREFPIEVRTQTIQLERKDVAENHMKVDSGRSAAGTKRRRVQKPKVAK